ncbi:MAG: TatD family hydrolase [bacterium]
MLPKLFDTHSHLQFQAYKNDASEVAKRMLEAGIWTIVVGSQSTTSADAVKFAEQYGDGVYAAIGAHPSHTHEQTIAAEEDDNELPTTPIKTRAEGFDFEYYKNLAASKKVVAVGEVGLDYYWLPKDVDPAPIKARQMEVFRDALNFADQQNLPLIIHAREAHRDVIGLFDEFIAARKLERRGVMHCFTGTWEEAAAYLERGFLISFTGIITFPPKKSNPAIQEALWETVRQVPLDKLMIETDAPYLAPTSHRGQRNEPLFVEEVARKVAQLKNISFEEVAAQTTATARKFFGV